MADVDYFNNFVENVAKKLIPDIKITFKNKSWLMHFIAFFIYLINRRFMSQYTTVLGNTVYFPSKTWLEGNYRRATSIIAHELVHLVDRSKEKKLMFEIKYLFPQILSIFSIFALLAVFSSYFLLFLVFLAFFAPWPAIYRLRYEATAYCMSIHYQEITHTTFDFAYWRDVYAKELSGMSYYMATYSKISAAKELTNRYDWCAKNHPACISAIMWLEAHHAKG